MAEARVERRLAAILSADVAGYSRLMGADEVGTLAALRAHRREIVDPAIAAHKGRIVKTTGDGMLVEFASAVDAVTCAVAVQEKMAARTAGGTEPRIQFRFGINVGDIIIDGDPTVKILGATVARRLRPRNTGAAVGRLGGANVVVTQVAFEPSDGRPRTALPSSGPHEAFALAFGPGERAFHLFALVVSQAHLGQRGLCVDLLRDLRRRR